MSQTPGAADRAEEPKEEISRMSSPINPTQTPTGIVLRPCLSVLNSPLAGNFIAQWLLDAPMSPMSQKKKRKVRDS